MVSTIVLIGIAAGAVVFVGTILMVFFLLHQGGSFDRMRQEAIGLPTAAGELKPLLYDELLAHAAQLPRKPAPLAKPLVGKLVAIRNYSVQEDAEMLHAISDGQPKSGIYRSITYEADEMIWRHLDHGPFSSAAEFAAAYKPEQPDNRHFVILNVQTMEPIGMMSLCNHSPRNLRIEIGDVWLTPAFQGSGANTEAVMIMLQHLFASKYRRVEWRCDGHNVRARRAAHSIGFAFEGVQRKHRVVKNCNRDTVVFAALNSDWPMIEEQLHAKLSALLQKASTRSKEPLSDLSKKDQ